MNNIVRSISNLFEGTINQDTKNLNESLSEFQTRIDVIVTEILKPYHNDINSAITTNG